MPLISQPHSSDKQFGWHVIRYQPTTLTGTVDDVLVTLPAYTEVLDAFIVCVRGDTGATTSTLDLEGGATTGQETAILTGASDNGGTIGLTTAVASLAARKTSFDAINLITLGGAVVKINCELTFAGTATVAPIFDIHIQYGRFEF